MANTDNDINVEQSITDMSLGESQMPFVTKKVRITGCPYALGQDLPGTELAPSIFRSSGLPDALTSAGWEVVDEGDLDCGSQLHNDSKERLKYLREKYDEWLYSVPKVHFEEWLGEDIRPPVSFESKGSSKQSFTKSKDYSEDKNPYHLVDHSEDVGLCMKSVHESVTKAVQSNAFALQLGGDHSLASASINAVAKKYPDVCIVWVDAHGDANTPETSPSMHYHGMSAAHAVGMFKENPKGFEWFDPECTVPENRLAYFGLRDIDHDEGQMLRDSEVHWTTMHEIDHDGIAKVFVDQMKRIDPSGTRPIHLSLDIDGIDPQFAPGTGTCCRGGLSLREIRYICTELANTGRLVSMDLVEVNPLLDEPPTVMHGDDETLTLMSPTVRLGCELILHALGKQLMPGVNRKITEACPENQAAENSVATRG